jgi:hypothetical protein
MVIDADKLFHEFYEVEKRSEVPGDTGVLTASTETMFVGAQLLCASLLCCHDVKIAIIDLGLTWEQREWCLKQSRVFLISPSWTQFICLKSQKRWDWNKPIFFTLSPFWHTIWIDADCFVVKEISKLFHQVRKEPFMHCDYMCIPKDDELYRILPIVGAIQSLRKYPDTGVVAFNRVRDQKIIIDWIYCVRMSDMDPNVANNIVDGSSGALGWALLKNDESFLPEDSPEFNYMVYGNRYYNDLADFLFKVRRDYTSHSNIVHWSGPVKPWTYWKGINMLNINTDQLFK